jgi:WD40 repeat protein
VKRRGNMQSPRSLLYVSALKLTDIIDQIDEPGKITLAATLKIDLRLLSAEISRTATDRSVRGRGQAARLAVAEEYLRQRVTVGDLTVGSGWFAGQAEMGWKPLQDCQTVLFCGYDGPLLVVLGGSVGNLRGYPASEVQTGSHVPTIRQAVLGGGRHDDFERDLEAAADEIYVMPQRVRFLARVLRRGPLSNAEYLLGTPLYVELADDVIEAANWFDAPALPRPAPPAEQQDLPARDTALLASDPRRIGRYEILRRLGEGSMGIVYHARDNRGSDVALKMIRPELAADPGFLGRFATEVAAARQVRSPFTARVIEAATSAQPAYLVTEFISGPTLQDHVTRTGPLSFAMARELCVGTATALEAVHNAGIIHGDLAPANIILSQSGPKVIDFGIAQPVLARPGHASTDLKVGTPAYMSPEQIEDTELTQASDVFSWASTMVYAMTGRQPFGTSSCVATVWYQILDHQPDLTDIPEPLRDIISAALSKNPDARPPARQLVARVRAIGSDCETRDRHRWWRPALAAGAAATLVAGGVVAVAMASQMSAAPVPRVADPVALEDPAYIPQALAYSPDGKLLAVGSANSDYHPTRGLTYVWDVADRNFRKPLSLQDPGGSGINDVAWNPAGTALAVADNNGTAYLWNVATRSFSLFLDPQHGPNADSLAWNPGGTVLAVGYSDGVIYLWNVATRRLAGQLAGPGTDVNALAWNQDGTRLAAGYDDGSVYVLTVATRRFAPLPGSPNQKVNDVKWQPDAKDILGAGAADGYTYIWNVATGTQPSLRPDPGDLSMVSAIAWNHTGTVMASGDYGGYGATYLWYGDARAPVTLTDPRGLGVEDEAFAPDGKTLAVADDNGNTYLWPVPSSAVSAQSDPRHTNAAQAG